jgi:hypothetical protein
MRVRDHTALVAALLLQFPSLAASPKPLPIPWHQATLRIQGTLLIGTFYPTTGRMWPVIGSNAAITCSSQPLSVLSSLMKDRLRMPSVAP